MKRRRRVVVTGLGAVAPNGIGAAAFWASLVAGRSAIGPISLFDASAYPCRIAAHAPVAHVSTELGLKGQALTLGSACTTGMDAIAWAATQIADGYADVALAGATDAPLAELAYASLCRLGILTKYDGPPNKAS